MPSIFAYRQVTDAYTTYQLRLPDGGIELATVDGLTFVSVPDGPALPAEQPAQIAPSLVLLTDEQVAQLRDVSPYGRLVARRVAERIRAGEAASSAKEWGETQLIALGLTADVPARIEAMRGARMAAGGARTTAQNWYPTTPEHVAIYAAWVALGAWLPATYKVQQMDGSQADLTPDLARTILLAVTDFADAYRTRARQAIAAYRARPSTFAMSAINWPARYAG